MIVSQKIAEEIAEEAYLNAGYSPTQYAGYYTIYENQGIDYAIAINKQQDDADNNKKYYAIFVSPSESEDTWYEFTDTLDKEELAKKIIDIAQNIQKAEEQ